MGDWTFDTTVTKGGTFQLYVTKLTPAGRSVNVTTFRGAPTQFDSYTDGDPFGDSTAQFSFPAITPFDDLKGEDLLTWLDYYSNVDLFYVPSLDYASQYAGSTLLLNPLTNKPDVVAPGFIKNSGGARTGGNRIKVFEGFLTSMDWTADESSAQLQISCQGALFQLDRYLQKPFYPAQPWPLEKLILDAFDSLPHTPRSKPHLRTSPLTVQFPAHWKLVVPKYAHRTNTAYTPVAKPGEKWSGYATRQTGSWDHALTGFVQDQLTVMLTDERTGVTTGNQWTIQQRRAAAGGGGGRAPVLLVRDRFRTPDFTVWIGTPGVAVHLSADSTQSENVIYGDGTGVDGTVWRNVEISNDGSRTIYRPLAAGRDVYPAAGDNRQYQKHGFVSEAYTKYGTGFDQPQATAAARQALARDREPGVTGSITLKTDPRDKNGNPMPRWLINSGMTVLVKGLLGSGDRGIPLHVSARSASPMDGSVELTVDSRYRDLLTVEEAQSRTRDPLTPVKMLQVNRTSVMIEDIQAPWDYTAGSGFVPTDSRHFFDYLPTSQVFPYTDWVRRHPPLHYPHWYAKVHAAAGYNRATKSWSAAASLKRWTQTAIPVLTSEKDTIARTQFFAVDVYGRQVKVPFHVSFYYVAVTPSDMPFLNRNYSPYQDNAFEKVDLNGRPTSNTLWPQDAMVIGWGSRANGVLNRCGFWPGRESAGASATGRMVDDYAWSYDNTTNPNFDKNQKPGDPKNFQACVLYAMIYCEYTRPVYFTGRIYRQNPGVS